MKSFEMTSSMNNIHELSIIHEQCDNDRDSKEERRSRYSYARGLLCSSPTPICISKRVARNVMVTCAVVGCLIAITFGMTMEKNNEHQHEGYYAHRPNWFDRSSKWKGQTYDEAVDFFTSNNQMLCPYKNICPFGPGGKSVGVGSGGFGFEEDNQYGLVWVAISNAPNA